MTRSRARQIQQEVNALLVDSNININKNFILPKSCVLLVLRFSPTKMIKVDKDSKDQDFISNVHCLRTSAYDTCIHWYEKMVEVYTKKATKLQLSINVAHAGPEFVPEVAAP
jgi:hypothetical protein